MKIFDKPIKTIFILLNILFGLFSGVIGGLGMGGGTILIPLLTIFLEYEQKLSQGLNLLSFLLMSIIAIIIHYKNGFMCLSKTWIILISGVFFSFIGAFFASQIDSSLLKIMFGVFLIILSVYQLSSVILSKKNDDKISKKSQYHL